MLMRKRVLILAVVLIVALGSYFVYWAYFAMQSQEIQATGTIEATTVDLNASISGVIKDIMVKEGDSLSQGQVVAEISRNDLLAQRERDAMALLKAEAQLADLLSGFRSQEIEEAEANVGVALATFKKSQMISKSGSTFCRRSYFS